MVFWNFQMLSFSGWPWEVWEKEKKGNASALFSFVCNGAETFFQWTDLVYVLSLIRTTHYESDLFQQLFFGRDIKERASKYRGPSRNPGSAIVHIFFINKLQQLEDIIIKKYKANTFEHMYLEEVSSSPPVISNFYHKLKLVFVVSLWIPFYWNNTSSIHLQTGDFLQYQCERVNLF